jgi:flagellar hook-length control protein FliK
MNALPLITPQRASTAPNRAPLAASTPPGLGAAAQGFETLRAPTPATRVQGANFSQALLSAQRSEPVPAHVSPKEPVAKAPNDEAADTARHQRHQLRQAAAAKALADRAAQRRQQPAGATPAPGLLSSGRLKAGLGLEEGAGTAGRNNAQHGDSADGADAIPAPAAGHLHHGNAKAHEDAAANAAGSGPQHGGTAALQETNAASRGANTATQEAGDARRAADAATAATAAETAAAHGAPTSADAGSATDAQAHANGSPGPTAAGHRTGATHGALRRPSAGEVGNDASWATWASSAHGLGSIREAGAGLGAAGANWSGSGSSGVWGATRLLGGSTLEANQAANQSVSTTGLNALLLTPQSQALAFGTDGTGLAADKPNGGTATGLAGAPLANPLAAGGEPGPAAWAATAGAPTLAPAGASAPALGQADFQTEGGLQSNIQAHPGSADFAREVGATIALRVQEGVQQARLQLSPAELGPVWVQIQLEGPSATVHLAAAQADTRAALEQALPTLAGQLSEAGFTLAGGGVSAQTQPGAGGPNFSGNGWTHDRNAPGDEKSQGLGRPNETMSTDLAAPVRWQGPRGLVDLLA